MALEFGHFSPFLSYKQICTSNLFYFSSHKTRHFSANKFGPIPIYQSAPIQSHFILRTQIGTRERQQALNGGGTVISSESTFTPLEMGGVTNPPSTAAHSLQTNPTASSILFVFFIIYGKKKNI